MIWPNVIQLLRYATLLLTKFRWFFRRARASSTHGRMYDPKGDNCDPNFHFCIFLKLKHNCFGHVSIVLEQVENLILYIVHSTL